MNLFKLSAVGLALLIIGSCKKDATLEEGKKETPGKHFLVDKIFDYHNRLLAEYFYNEAGRLTKRSTYDPVNYPGDKTTDLLFSYEQGRISRIEVIDYTHPQFNHDFSILYNDAGNIVRHEVYQRGQMISYNNYVYNDGRVTGTADDSGHQNFFINYNGTVNAEQSKFLVADDGDIGNDGFVEINRSFLYDDHPKPDFGMGKVFQVEPFPGFGSEATMEKNISGNNMLEFAGGSRWLYTYNEDGLPATVETKWKDVETAEPMMLRITYKEREVKE